MSTRRLCLLAMFLSIFYGIYSSDSEEPQKDVLKLKKSSKKEPNGLESQHSTAVNHVLLSLLKKMKKNSWKEMHKDNISQNKMQYELHDLGTEVQTLLSKKSKALEGSNFQAILNALVWDYFNWESNNFEKESGYGKVFFESNKYALYASGVTRKWIVFELNDKIWTQIFGGAQIYFKYWKRGWDIPQEIKITHAAGSMSIANIRLREQIRRFKEMTKIPSDKLKKYTRAAYYEREKGTGKKEFYGYYPVTNVCYENSSTKYRVSWKDGSKDALLFEDDLFEGELQVGYEVSVSINGLNAEYVGYIKSIRIMSNKKQYNIEWKTQVQNTIMQELVKNNAGPMQNYFEEDDIITVRNKKKKRRRESSADDLENVQYAHNNKSKE